MTQQGQHIRQTMDCDYNNAALLSNINPTQWNQHSNSHDTLMLCLTSDLVYTYTHNHYTFGLLIDKHITC